MKKLIFSAAVLASAFFAASCQQEEFAPAAEGNVVTFEVSIPEVVATKAGEGYQADGSNVNDLVYAVYSTTADNLEDAQADLDDLRFFYAVNETSGKSFNDEGKSVVSLELLNDLLCFFLVLELLEQFVRLFEQRWQHTVGVGECALCFKIGDAVA